MSIEKDKSNQNPPNDESDSSLQSAAELIAKLHGIPIEAAESGLENMGSFVDYGERPHTKIVSENDGS